MIQQFVTLYRPVHDTTGVVVYQLVAVVVQHLQVLENTNIFISFMLQQFVTLYRPLYDTTGVVVYQMVAAVVQHLQVHKYIHFLNQLMLLPLRHNDVITHSIFMKF